jgi:outer membrane protein insertion porin family
MAILRNPKLNMWLFAMVLLMGPGITAFGVGPSDIEKLIGKRVSTVDIVVEGAPSSETREMRDVITVRPDQSFSVVQIHDSLYGLFQSGLISAARVEAEPVGSDGVAIKFVVRPQAKVDSIEFEGSPAFALTQLRSQLTQLDVGARLTPGLVARSASELQAFYVGHGYYDASIDAEVKLDATGSRAAVVYTITSGPAAKVARSNIEIVGESINFATINHAVVEGKPFSDTDVQEEVDRIKEAYLKQGFLGVRVADRIAPDASNNSVAVTITVDSGPRASIDVQGLELTDKEKREVLPSYTQGGIDDFSLEEGRRRLVDYAQRQGYFFAQVTRPSGADLSQAKVQLSYVVNPGQRYRLAAFEIIGESAIPPKDLLLELKSKQSTLVSFTAPRRGITSSDLLRRDANHIQTRLRDMGYRRAQVQVLRGIALNGSDLIVTFEVIQGPRTYVDEVSVRGNLVVTADKLLPRITLKPDEPLVKDAINKSSDRLLTAYTALGYANAKVVPEIIDVPGADGRDRVKMVYDIDEGRRVRILHITTNGMAPSETKRIEHDFYLFKPGDWLRSDKLQDTERALYNTNAFSSVTINSAPGSGTNDGVENRDITVDLASAKPFLLIYSLGYQTKGGDPTLPGVGVLHGAEGLVQLTDTDMFSRLDTGSIQFRVAQDQILGQLSFEDPRPFGINSPLIISVFAQRRAQPSFSSNRYAGSIQLEHRLSANSLIYFGYTFERITVFDLELSSILQIERDSVPVRLGMIGPSYFRDTRDSVFEPSKGSLTTGSFSVASVAFGGDAQFVKLLIEHDRYYKVPYLKGVVYSVSGKLGLASGFGGDKTLPISERFFAGGPEDLRGFGFEEAGPIDPGTGVPLGGDALVVLRNEIRFPIWNFLGGAVFSDTGNVFARIGDIAFSNMTETLGFGFRVKTPIGPLRFDLGFLVFNKPPGQHLYRFDASFGQTF